MGGEYLRHEGAHEEVWMAVKAHYRPVGAEDAVPSTPLGCLLSLCDKLDTVVGCFAVGLIPSGSKDPLALRRAGQGIVRILWERGWANKEFQIPFYYTAALQGVGLQATRPKDETLAALEGFFNDRVTYLLEQSGYAGHVRRSAMAPAWFDLHDLKARCDALQRVTSDPSFNSLKESAKRIGNILKDEATPSLDLNSSVLVDSTEKELYRRLIQLDETFSPDRYSEICDLLADLAGPLESFFNAVMVKCEDPALRAARLGLLHRLRQAFLRVADFSLWQ